MLVRTARSFQEKLFGIKARSCVNLLYYFSVK